MTMYHVLYPLYLTTNAAPKLDTPGHCALHRFATLRLEFSSFDLRSFFSLYLLITLPIGESGIIAVYEFLILKMA